MDVFTTGILTLLGVTAVFYVVLFSFIYYWHLKKLTFVVVPLIFTFEFFLKGFLLVAIISIIFNALHWQVLPVAAESVSVFDSAQLPWWVVFWRIAGAFALIMIIAMITQGGKKDENSFRWLLLVPTLLLPVNIFWWVFVPFLILLFPSPFWWPQLKKIVWDPFWWLILLIIILWVPFLRVWWWLFLPWMLMLQLKIIYKWWMDWDFNYVNKQRWVFLEIIPPKEVLMPMKAMEDIFSAIWPLMDIGNFRELWCDGMLANGPQWCSWEIASLEGKVHFYLRVMQQHQTTLESALYGHYPEVEIREAVDYVKLVPPTAPNEEWDVYGEDWKLEKPPAYPIKTYEKFFEPQGERIVAEEKRMDPIIGLLEALSKLGPGENYWIQFTSVPVPDRDEPEWRKEGQKIVDKLAKRPEKKEVPAMMEIGNTLKELFMGPQKEGSGESAKYSWETIIDEETGERQISLTPGEREMITEIDNKLKKPAWRVNIRGIYVAKRENWNASNRAIMRSYMGHFQIANMNYFRFDIESRTRIHFFMRERRVFLRARKMFRMALLRFPPFYPDRRKSCPILSTEELATLYHLPFKISGMVAQSLEKIESKKAGPPPNLPVEE